MLLMSNKHLGFSIRCYVLKYEEKTHIVASARSSSRIKTKGKGHVSFPNRRLFQPTLALQAALITPHLKASI